MEGNNLPNSPGYETTDVHVQAVGKFAFALIAIILVSLGLLIGLFKYFQSREAANQAKTIDGKEPLIPVWDAPGESIDPNGPWFVPSTNTATEATSGLSARYA
jgi:hypothetical protein